MRKCDNFKIYMIIGLLVITGILISSLTGIMTYNTHSKFNINPNYEKTSINKQNGLLNYLNTDNKDNKSKIYVNSKISSNSNPLIGEKLYRLCKECSETPSVMKFSPNNKLFAIALQNGSIMIYQMSSGEKIGVIHNANVPVKQIIWTSDSKFILTSANDYLNFWDTSNDTLIKKISFKNELQEINFFDLAYDNKILAISGSNGRIGLWSLDEFQFQVSFIKYISEHVVDSIITLKFSFDNNFLAFYSMNGTVFIWNERSETLNSYQNDLPSGILAGFQYNIFSDFLSFSSNSSVLFIAGSIDELKGIDDTSRLIKYKLKGVGSNSVCTGLNTTKVFYSDADFSDAQSIKIYDYNSEQFLKEFQGYQPQAISCSNDGTFLAYSQADKPFVTIVSAIVGSEKLVLNGHSEPVSMTRFLNKNMFVSVSQNDNTVKLWNNSNLLKSVNIIQPVSVAITKTSNNSILIGIGTNNGGIFLYNYSSDQIIPYPSSSGGLVWWVDFSPDSKLFLTIFKPIEIVEGNIKIWNVTTNQLFKTLVHLPSISFSKAVFYDSNTIIAPSPSNGNTLDIWNINAGIVVNHINFAFSPYNSHWISSLEISHDRSLLAVSDFDTTDFTIINITNIANPTFTNYKSNLYSICTCSVLEITPDNRYIINIYPYAGKIKIFELANMSNNFTLDADLEPFNVASFNDDDWSLLTSYSDYSVVLLDFSPLKNDKEPFSKFDLDNDGMNDGWEIKNNLNNLNYWDRFDDPDSDGLLNWEEYSLNINPQSIDTDRDGISDSYEVKFHLNPNSNDALLDKDGDGMNNLYEFNMGLDSSKNDSYFDYDNDGLTNLQEFYYQTDIHNPDTDFDGMPDKWEVDNHLNPIDGTDALKDNDFDGISNLDEFKAGSDPNNFFNVPLISINNFYILMGLIIASIASIGLIQYRKTTRDKYLSPDYKSAMRVRRAGLKSWNQFLNLEKRVNYDLIIANELLNEGKVSESLSTYMSSLNNLQKLNNNVEKAENLIILIFINKKLLKVDNYDFESSISQFKFKTQNKLLETYNNIIQGFKHESANNIGLALELWKNALKTNILQIDYSLIIEYSIIDLMIKQNQAENSIATRSSIERRITNLIQKAEDFGRFDFVCGSNLLMARLLFFEYKLDEAVDYIEKNTKMAKEMQYYLYIDLASKEIDNFNKRKENIKQSLNLTETNILSQERDFEKRKKQIDDYLIEAKKIIEKDKA